MARQNVLVVESHDDIARLTIPQLKAWVESANLKYKSYLNEGSLVTLAGILLDRLHGWKDPDIQARLRAFQVHGFSKKALAVGNDKARHTPETPELESYEDIARLTTPQLTAWIGSVNFKYKKQGLRKHPLVTLAGLLLDQTHGRHDPDIQARLKLFQPQVSARKTEPRQRPTSFKGPRTRTRKTPSDYELISSRGQLQGLEISALGKWMQLQGFISGRDKTATL